MVRSQLVVRSVRRRSDDWWCSVSDTTEMPEPCTVPGTSSKADSQELIPATEASSLVPHRVTQ